MGNEVSVRGGNMLASFEVPDDIKQELAGREGNIISEKFTTNSLTFGNGAWTMIVNGEPKVLQRRNEDGDMENVQTLRLIVLGFSAQRERSWHDGPYDASNQRAPDCWSKNGRSPDANAAMPQAQTCVMCEHGAKGGSCRQHRVLVVIPAGDLNAPALRLKIAITSDWDKQDEAAMAQGWYGFSNYTDFLRAHGVNHTGILVTRARFDPNPKITYSKIQFARGDFLSAADRALMYERAKSDEVQELLNQNWSAPKPQGKSLPAPAADPVFSQSGASAQAAQEHENARLRAAEEAEAAKHAAEAKAVRAAQAAKEKAAAEDKARKLAELQAQMKALEAEVEAPAAPVEAAPVDNVVNLPTPPAPPKRGRPPKAAEPAPAPAAPIEVPDKLQGMLDAWG